jgi:hypothetical protein
MAALASPFGRVTLACLKKENMSAAGQPPIYIYIYISIICLCPYRYTATQMP